MSDILSDTLWFQRLKLVRQRCKDAVFGYIRQQQKLLPASVHYNIPPLIQNICLLYYYIVIDSTILTLTEQDIFLNLLEKNNKFNDLLYNHSWNLIFRASKNGFGRNEFIKTCHNQSHLICLIHTKSNNVFGGYTSLGWSGDGDVSYNTATDPKAFIFLLRSNKQYPPTIRNVILPGKALRTQYGYYMMFGDAPAIYLHDQPNIHKKSGTHGPHCYEPFPSKHYINSGEAMFTVKDFEVFQLNHDS